MMSVETVLARRFDTGQAVKLTLKGHSATRIDPAESAPDDVWLAPALFDPQINGFAGVDFQRDDLRFDELKPTVAALRAAGCGQFFATLITAPFELQIERLKKFRKLREKHPLLQSAIAGWHLEGPFLSERSGFHGAHDPALMLDPNETMLRVIRDTAGDDLVLLTLSPERRGAIEAIAVATALKMRVSLGHTDASAEVLARAVQAGASGFTHLGNGCPQSLDRHDNILLRAFETPGLTVTLIPDRLHISPPMFRLIHKVLPAERIAYTTDAMAAAGAPPGRFRIGKVETEVGADGIVRMPGQTNFAGSSLRPIEGIVRAATMLGCSWREVWARASLGARRYAGALLKQEGAPFCLLKSEGNELKSGQIFAGSERMDLVLSTRS